MVDALVHSLARVSVDCAGVSRFHRAAAVGVDDSEPRGVVFRVLITMVLNSLTRTAASRAYF